MALALRRLVLASAAGLAGLALVAACLPDLGPVELATEKPETGPEPSVVTSACGDGVIATLDDGGDAGESCDPGEAGAGASFLGCASCRVACDGVVDPATDHCFFDAGTADSFFSARLRCEDLGAHVATFASAREARLLGPGAHWVGLVQREEAQRAYFPERPDEPGWPCPGCFAERGDAGPGPGFEPLPSRPSGICVASVDGVWRAVACDDGGAAYATICEREPLGRRGQACGGAICFTLPRTAGEKTYVLFASSEPPEIAAQTCRSYPGGSLVLLDSAEEREQLAREVLKFLPGEIATTLWIGLALNQGTWRWDDGAPESSRPPVWGQNQPAGPGAGRAFLRMREGFVDTQLAFSEDKREARRPFVCQRAP